MEENKCPYKSFEKFVFRTPSLPLNNTLADFKDSQLIKESIFLASPDLFDALQKSQNLSFQDFDTKLSLSLIKYITRMRSRCTPFGLFAGCGVGNVGDKSGITLEGLENFKSTTRLDMNFLCALNQAVSEDALVQSRLRFYPNNSSYEQLDGYRFIEYKYRNGKRKHFLSVFEKNEFLETVLERAKHGAFKRELVESILQDDIKEEEALEFIDTLIQSQFLISELAPSVTGEDMLNQLITRLDDIPEATEMNKILKSIKNKLHQIDSAALGRSITLYQEIEGLVKRTNVQYDRKFLFQSDVSISPVTASLDKKLIDASMDGIKALNRLTENTRNQAMEKFKKEFYARYEDEEISLAEALDSDIGIGFAKLTPGNTDIHRIIEGIPRVSGTKQNSTSLGQIETFLLEKYNEVIQKNLPELELKDEDLMNLKEDWDDLPPTMSTMTEIIEAGNTNTVPLIYLGAIGGSSAANLLGRFCHTSPMMHEFVSEIVAKENNLLEESKVYAEIVHLPEARTGNILYRPSLRKFEIPYLAKQSVNSDCTIPVSDLMISVRGGIKIKLRSKRLNKEIVPRLTNAHAYQNNSLPIYHFLSLLQTDGYRSSLFFSWGGYLSQKRYLPRVRYKNVILSLARWKGSPADFKAIKSADGEEFLSKMLLFKNSNAIPDHVMLVEGDNKLLIDFNDPLSVQLLYSKVKKQNFILEEHLHKTQDPLVVQGSNIYNNQVILSFYKNTLNN